MQRRRVAVPRAPILHRISGCLTAFSVVFAAKIAVAQTYSTPPDRGSPPKDNGKNQDTGGKKDGGSGGRKNSDPTSGKKRLDPTKRHRDSGDDDDDHERNKNGSGAISNNDSSSSTTTIELGNAQGLIAVGGHISVAGPALRETAKPLGFGPDVTLGLGPKAFPLLFGVQAGFDWFGTESARFTYDAMLADWDLNRRAFWAHAFVRFQPTTGVLRPHIDLLGGVWIHDVTIDLTGVADADEADTIGQSHTGSYGLSAGLDCVLPGGFLVGLSAMHLRGGRITVPNTNDIAVVNNVLYYTEEKSRPIYQWTFMLNIGFTSR